MTTRLIYCCNCKEEVDAVLVTGAGIYPHRPDLKALPFWQCKACNAFVGCHHKTKDRRGRLVAFQATPSGRRASVFMPSLTRFGNQARLNAASFMRFCLKLLARNITRRKSGLLKKLNWLFPRRLPCDAKHGTINGMKATGDSNAAHQG